MSKTKRKIPEAFKAHMKKKGENHLTGKKPMESTEKREIGPKKNEAREKYMIERSEMLLKKPIAGMINKKRMA